MTSHQQQYPRPAHSGQSFPLPAPTLHPQQHQVPPPPASGFSGFVAPPRPISSQQFVHQNADPASQSIRPPLSPPSGFPAPPAGGYFPPPRPDQISPAPYQQNQPAPVPAPASSSPRMPSTHMLPPTGIERLTSQMQTLSTSGQGVPTATAPSISAPQQSISTVRSLLIFQRLRNPLPFADSHCRSLVSRSE